MDYSRKEIQEYISLKDERLVIPLNPLGITCKDYVVIDKWRKEEYLYLIVLFYMDYPHIKTYSVKGLIVGESGLTYEGSHCIVNRLLSSNNLDIEIWDTFREHIRSPCELEIPLASIEYIRPILTALDINFHYFLSNFQKMNLENGNVIKIGRGASCNLGYVSESINSGDNLRTIPAVDIRLDYNYPLGTAPGGVLQFTYKGKVINISEQLLIKNDRVGFSFRLAYKPLEFKLIDYWGNDELLNIIYITSDASNYYLEIMELGIGGKNKGLISFHQNAQPILDRLISNRGTSFKLLRWLINNLNLETPCLIKLPIEMEEAFLRLIDTLGRKVKKLTIKESGKERDNPALVISTKGDSINYKLFPIESDTIIQMYETNGFTK